MMERMDRLFLEGPTFGKAKVYARNSERDVGMEEYTATAPHYKKVPFYERQLGREIVLRMVNVPVQQCLIDSMGERCSAPGELCLFVSCCVS